MPFLFAFFSGGFYTRSRPQIARPVNSTLIWTIRERSLTTAPPLGLGRVFEIPGIYRAVYSLTPQRFRFNFPSARSQQALTTPHDNPTTFPGCIVEA